MMVKAIQKFGRIAERLHIIEDKASGLRGVIAIDSTALGPSAGGCRLWHYASEDALTTDAMRLARGMTYKNALAGLPFGGGKAVLQRPVGTFDRQTVFRVLAEAIEQLDGLYITAEDVGTSLDDMRIVREHTRFVAGLQAKPGFAGGDPSPWTALGVFRSMEAAARLVFDSDLDGLRVAVQGAGNVGSCLCRLLAKAGASLVIADVNRERADALAKEVGASVVGTDEIFGSQTDIFAPCALGGIINEDSIPRLRARLICGGANNQIATEADGDALQRWGITYAPDYLVNAGGIINVAAEYLGETTEQVRERVNLIPHRLRELLRTSARTGEPTHRLADAMAEEIINSCSVEIG